MVERIQDLNLPSAIVQRLIKEALPDNISISKDARTAIGKAASVFTIYLSCAATNEAKKLKHKTITTQNILDALEETEFESFVDPVKEALETYHKIAKAKKEKLAAEKKNKSAAETEKQNGSVEADGSSAATTVVVVGDEDDAVMSEQEEDKDTTNE